MVDPRLERADATKLDELREILAQQEGADGLCPIEMDRSYSSHGAIQGRTTTAKAPYRQVVGHPGA